VVNAFYYSNIAVVNSIGNPGGISNSAASVYCATAPSGYPGSFPFKLVLANGQATEEIVQVNSGAGTVGTPWAITRGQDGTIAQAQPAAASVTHMLTAGDATLSRTHEAAAAAQLPHGLPAAAWLSGVFQAITERTLSSNASTETFSSIPGSYSHLLLIVNARATEASDQANDMSCVVNGDSGTNYSYLSIYASNISGAGTGALAQSQGNGSGVTSWPILRINASLAGSAVNAGGGFAIIPNYAGSAFGKMFMSMSGAGNGNGAMVDGRVKWGWYTPGSQAAISSLTLTAPGGGSFLTGSYFGLYGIG
jgi:hypothetical protein